MSTFKLFITALAIAGASTLIPLAHAQSAGGQAPAAQALDPQDHSAHHPAAESAQPTTPADGKMSGMHGKMVAEMKAQDAKLESLVLQMKAAKGEAKTQAIEELLTTIVQQQKSMHDGMMQMQAPTMMQMHEQMKPTGAGK